MVMYAGRAVATPCAVQQGSWLDERVIKSGSQPASLLHYSAALRVETSALPCVLWCCLLCFTAHPKVPVSTAYCS